MKNLGTRPGQKCAFFTTAIIIKFEKEIINIMLFMYPHMPEP